MKNKTNKNLLDFLSIIFPFSQLFNIQKEMDHCHSFKPKQFQLPNYIIENLNYFNPGSSKKLATNNLTSEDIKKLYSRIDFSVLPLMVQEKLLQDIIYLSNYSPLIAKSIKKNIMNATISVNADAISFGEIQDIRTKKVPKKLIFNSKWKTSTFLHEYMHLIHGYDGVLHFDALFNYMRNLSEAHARGFDFIIEARLNSLFLNTLGNAYTSNKSLSFVNKILLKRFETNSHKNFENKREAICYAEEETIGILMRCLLTHNKKHRLEILKKYVPNSLTAQDISYINKYAKYWRQSYDIQSTTHILNSDKNILKSELKKIPFVNTYYTNITHIPISCLNIKIKNGKTQLFNLLQEEKTK